MTPQGHGPMTPQGHGPMTPQGHGPLTPQGHGAMTPQSQGQYYQRGHPGGSSGGGAGAGGIYEEGTSQYIDEASVSLCMATVRTIIIIADLTCIQAGDSKVP